MIKTPADRASLCAFFNIKPRGLSPVLRDLKIRLVGGQVQWPVVFRAFGLALPQNPANWPELVVPLMTPQEVGAYCGVTSRTVYRWRHGIGLPDELPAMPTPLDLSGGRAHARKLRWHRSEIVSWQDGRTLQPVCTRIAPAFGSLAPTR